MNNSLDEIFSKYSYQTSIFSILLTRTLRYFDLIKIIEPRLIGKVTVEHVLNEVFEKSVSKKYSLILAHLMAPHKPFAWERLLPLSPSRLSAAKPPLPRRRREGKRVDSNSCD